MDSAQPLYDLAPVARLMLLGVVIALGPLAWVWLRNRHAPPAQRLRVLTLVTLFLTFDLVLFGETNDNGDELPGRVFRPNSDYTLDDTTGDIEFGSAFNGAVVKLNAAGAPITSVLSSYGADEGEYTGYYVVEDSPIQSARDLINKKVGMNTLGAHHEFIVREWLAQEGLTNDEINTVELTVVPPVNTEQALRAGQIAVASLNGIHRESALERGGIRPLFTDKSLFGAFSYGTYVLRDDFIAQNPEVTEDFVQGTARAIRWTQVTPRDEVVDRFREIITSRGRNENTKTIEYWRSPGIPVPGAVIADRELRTWIDWLVRNGELEPGRLTAEDLYTNKFNPYANGTYSAGSGPDGEAVGTK